MSVVIREMMVSDLDDVWQINQENVPAVGEESIDALAEILAMSSISLVAEWEKTVVGFCMVLPPGTAYKSPNYEYFCRELDDFIYLDRVAVTAAWQGKGIGADLYREVESRSTAEWFALEVNTKPRNEGSLKFHAREGFVEMEECETRPGKKVSLMAKKLRG